MATIINLTAPGSSTTIDDAIFVDSANIGSGTGNYNTFLALSPTPSQSGNEQGFNSNDTPPIDPSNQDVLAHLDRLAGETGHWPKLANLFVSEIEKIEDPRRAIDPLLVTPVKA